jgi:lysophospholipid acyltransferase (LPLAT)-like uncharacterized protein
MRRKYYTPDDKPEIDITCVLERLAAMVELTATQPKEEHDKQDGKNLWTRTVDAVISFLRRHARPVHWLGYTLTAVILFIYARLVALTARLETSGDARWPNVRAPAVVALWHGDAPSLVAAFAMRKPKEPAVILIGSNPRGDCLTLLCRMLGLEVVRKSGRRGDWSALGELAKKLTQGAFVIITADGDGPAKIAKAGAIALASATGVPLVPLVADCHPAVQQSHKWDVARNPLPFSSVTVWMGPPRRFEPFTDRESIEFAGRWLTETLNKRSILR